MCGIVGIVDFSQPVSPAVIRGMCDAIRHRGPDEDGFYVEGCIGLGVRRLAIVDIAGGHQPMSNEEGTIHLVFNGEIYNFEALRKELIRKGHQFKTHADTEVVVHSYEEWDVGCLQKFRGMFAFSLWDEKKKRLFLARDRIGKKPLVYAFTKKRLAFASEIRGLLKVPDLSREIDPVAIDHYMTLQYIPSPWTAFTAIKKLPPAHWLLCEKGEVRVERYWQLPVHEEPLGLSLEDAKEGIRAKLREATNLRMHAEVPLGAFLSGGIDSSIIVSLMSQISPKPVKTFSVGFENQAFSELPYAKTVAERCHTEHTEFIVKPEMTEVLPKLALHFGEPFGDSSALPTYYVAKEARRHVTVALTGDGGDENFGGYTRYGEMLRYAPFDHLPTAVRDFFFHHLSPQKGATSGFFTKVKRFARHHFFSPSRADRYAPQVQVFSPEEKEDLYQDSFRETLKKTPRPAYLEDFFRQVRDRDLLTQLLYVDFNSYLPECLMPKVDITSMANSLEARSPFLDHEFVELVFRLRSNWKRNGRGQAKWILKEAFRNDLPVEVLQRTKMGFGIPLDEWFRHELREMVEDLLRSTNSMSRHFFKPAPLQTLIQEHVTRERSHGSRLWNLLMLELWYRGL